jgi:hypothetical protein
MLSATIAPAVQSSWKEFASTANCGPQRELWLGRHLCRSEDFRSDPLCESRPVNLQIRLLILRHDRRRILWLGATAHPTAEWIARQLTEACGWERAPEYLIHDRDRAYGEVFTWRVRAMGIRDRPTSPRSPSQNAYAERLIGSIRRECLDYVVVLGSIAHPTQSLCTLRGRCYHRLTQHSLPGGPLRLYPDRPCTGWIAPALPGAFRNML